jgi:hypothetical protein
MKVFKASRAAAMAALFVAMGSSSAPQAIISAIALTRSDATARDRINDSISVRTLC